VRKTEASIGKAPRSGIHNHVRQTPLTGVRTNSERDVLGTEVKKNFIEDVCVGWRVHESYQNQNFSKTEKIPTVFSSWVLFFLVLNSHCWHAN